MDFLVLFTVIQKQWFPRYHIPEFRRESPSLRSVLNRIRVYLFIHFKSAPVSIFRTSADDRTV